jgi:hypothetical protein
MISTETIRARQPAVEGRTAPLAAGLDLDCWVPPRRWDWFACLEVLEHLTSPTRLLDMMCDAAVHGVVVTTPNPEVVDVLALDPTHRTPGSTAIPPPRGPGTCR